MVLLDVLGERWTLRILWELSSSPATFRALRERCDGVSPTLLNRRLKQLRALALVDHQAESGYGLTRQGASLVEQLMPLHRWADEWAEALEEE